MRQWPESLREVQPCNADRLSRAASIVDDLQQSWLVKPFCIADSLPSVAQDDILSARITVYSLATVLPRVRGLQLLSSALSPPFRMRIVEVSFHDPGTSARSPFNRSHIYNTHNQYFVASNFTLPQVGEAWLKFDIGLALFWVLVIHLSIYHAANLSLPKIESLSFIHRILLDYSNSAVQFCSAVIQQQLISRYSLCFN